MKKKKNKTKPLIITGCFIFLLVAVLIIIILAQPKAEDDWTGEMGDINIVETEEDIETLPGNITDSFGLEYEYTRIASLGFETYVPVGWEVLCEKDYIYFIAPESETDYKYTEIAFCVSNINSGRHIKDAASLTMLSEYVQNNLRYHSHNIPFVISTISGNVYTELYDMDKPKYIVRTTDKYEEYDTIPEYASNMIEGYHFIGYYCAPKLVFVHEDDPIRSQVQPYSVYYQLYMDGQDTTVFAAVNGPLATEERIQEIGKTIAYNTNPYKNTKYDYRGSFEEIKMKRVKIGSLEFATKDMEDIEEQQGTDYYVSKLSSDPENLAYQSYFIVREHRYEENYKDIVDDSFMLAEWNISNENVETLIKKYARNKLLQQPVYSTSKENVVMMGKEAVKVIWSVDMPYGSDARKYTNAIMPAKFCTYVIPDGENVYTITISYTTYQKYSALNYLEKVLSISRLD